jgi:hypothetical protein
LARAALAEEAFDEIGTEADFAVVDEGEQHQCGKAQHAFEQELSTEQAEYLQSWNV